MPFDPSFSLFLAFSCLFFRYSNWQKEFAFIIDKKLKIGLVYLNLGDGEPISENAHKISPDVDSLDLSHYLSISEKC